jgi:hypothetical protein
MKLKTDFITNSSSTAYIVFIPNRFIPSRHDVMQAYKVIETNFGLLEGEIEKNELYEKVCEMVESLKMDLGEGIGCWNSYGDVSREVWNTCLELCGFHDFVLSYIDISSDGGSIIKGIPEEDIWKILSNSIDLTDLLKDFIKEEK